MMVNTPELRELVVNPSTPNVRMIYSVNSVTREINDAGKRVLGALTSEKGTVVVAAKVEVSGGVYIAGPNGTGDYYTCDPQSLLRTDRGDHGVSLLQGKMRRYRVGRNGIGDIVTCHATLAMRRDVQPIEKHLSLWESPLHDLAKGEPDEIFVNAVVKPAGNEGLMQPVLSFILLTRPNIGLSHLRGLHTEI